MIVHSVIAFALLLAASLPVQAETPTGLKENVSEKICGTTEEEFLISAVNSSKAKVHVANEKAMKLILDNINKARTENKLWAFEADKLRIGIIQQNNQVFIGIAMFKDKCVVPGSVKVVPALVFIEYITELGLSMDDFPKELGI